MRKSKIDLTGKKFHNLTCLEYIGSKIAPDGKTRPLYKCKCDCGNIVEVFGKYLSDGHIKSCGCRKLKVASKRAKTVLHQNNTTPFQNKSNKARKDNKVGIKNISYINTTHLYEISVQRQGKKLRTTSHTLEEAIKIKSKFYELLKNSQ